MIGIFCYLLLSVAVAATFKVNNEIILNNTSTTQANLYILKNRSTNSLWLQHEPKHPSASAGWSSQLGSGHVSAIWMLKPHFYLKCQVANEKGMFVDVSCKKNIEVKILAICKMPKLASQSSYWVVENQKKLDLIKILAARGFEICNDPQRNHKSVIIN